MHACLEKFLQENTILVGIILGPKSLERILYNKFLEPVVEESLQWWKQVVHNKQAKSCFDKSCIAVCRLWHSHCTKYTCGFVGHGVHLLYSKCMQLYMFHTERFGDKPDHSNFNWQEWTPRMNQNHRLQASKHRMARPVLYKAKQAEVEHQSGFHYSVLLKLPYFHSPAVTIIAPMQFHFWVYTAKKMIEIWKTDGSTCILLNKNLTDLQEKIDGFVTSESY